MTKSKNIVKRTFLISWLSFNIIFWNILNRIRPKISVRKKYLCHFRQKWISLRINLVAGKSFRFYNVRFKIIPTEKTFSKKIFDSVTFSLFGSFWPKMTYSLKRIFRGKFFRFRDFPFEKLFETFWISSDQKISPKNFFDIVISYYFHCFGQKITRSEKIIEQDKNVWVRDFRFRIRFERFLIDVE